MTPIEYEQYLRKLGARNQCEGVLCEPRIFYAPFVFPGDGVTNLVRADPGVFRNGEQFPVRITHLTTYIRAGEVSSPPIIPTQGDERAMQFYSMKARCHDTDYMNSLFVPLPLWHNKQTAASDIVTRGSSTWFFDKYYTMSARDGMVVQVSLDSNPTQGQTRRVTVGFDGTGRLSKRPYKLSSTLDVANITPVTLNPDDFRNDGIEPIDISSMSVFCGSQSASSTPAGDIQQLYISVRQDGNGINKLWNVGPIDTATFPRCPAALYGVSTGRAIVHQLPVSPQDGTVGWLWEPGEGVDFELLSSRPDRNDTLFVAACGYIMVT